jgi:hypothetical protein
MNTEIKSMQNQIAAIGVGLALALAPAITSAQTTVPAAQTVGGVAVTTTVTYKTNVSPVITPDYTTNLTLTATSTNLTVSTNFVTTFLISVLTNVITTSGPITGTAVNTLVSNTIAGVSPGGVVAPAPDISTPANFFSTVLGWLTSMNPTNAFGTNDIAEIWMGAGYVSGINVGALTGFELRPLRDFAGLQLRSVTGWAGINGVVTSQELTVGYALQEVDMQFAPYVGAGYDFVSPKTDANGHAPYMALGAEIQKKMTTRTFLGVGLEVDLLGKHTAQPTVFALTGATF